VTPKPQKRIPIPSRPGGKWFDSLKRCRPMDSFLVATEQDRRSVLQYAYYHGLKITTRKENGLGFRVWRL
jgi:hypothetical protein